MSHDFMSKEQFMLTVVAEAVTFAENAPIPQLLVEFVMCVSGLIFIK